MSSTSQLTTFSDLYTDLLNRVRVSTGVTGTENQAKRYINIALNDIHLGFDYKLPWCERQAVLRTKAPYTTGTISLTPGSTTLTSTGTAWTTTNTYGELNGTVDGKILVSGETNIYRVSSADGGLQMTLSTKYVGDAAVTDSEYIHFVDEYILDGTFLRPLDFQKFSSQMDITLLPRHEFRRRFPYITVSGKPKYAAIIEDSVTTNSTAFRRVVLYPYPNATYLIPYTYITSAVGLSLLGSSLTSLSSDTDQPIMPLRYRHAIIYHALYHWYRDKKDDSRSDAAKQEYVDIMQRITGDHDVATHTLAQLQPRGGYQSAARSPYSYRGGHRIYDLNNEFDSFRR